MSASDVVRVQVMMATFILTKFARHYRKDRCDVVLFYQASESYCYVVQDVASGGTSWTELWKHSTSRPARATSTCKSSFTTTRTVSDNCSTTLSETIRVWNTTQPWTCSSTEPRPTRSTATDDYTLSLVTERPVGHSQHQRPCYSLRIYVVHREFQ